MKRFRLGIQGLLCVLGFHDWKVIGFQGIYFHQENIVDRVCLYCGKQDLRKTKYLRNLEKEK